MSLALLVPVLDRPQNVAPLLESIYATTPGPYRVLFICDPDDTGEIAAIAREGGSAILSGGSYASKINAGIRATTETLVFLGADDLRFTAGWLPAATARLGDQVHVVGVNDGLQRERRPDHATHFLMTRAYAQQPTADGQPGPLSTAYSHSFVDDELIATATARDAYAYEPRSLVKHLHWVNGTAADDETYRRGRAQFRQDRKTFGRRSALWI